MTHLKITGMTCDSCAAHVKEAFDARQEQEQLPLQGTHLI